jgi:dienelactone hydrolase
VANAVRCKQIFGKNDTHVPPEGRDLIRKTLHEKGVLFSFYEVAWAQRKFSVSLSL